MKWKCKRCEAIFDDSDKKCNCLESPSPWEPIEGFTMTTISTPITAIPRKLKAKWPDNIKFMTTKEKAEKLESFGPYEGTELAEFWYKLTDLYLWNKIYMTEDFWLQVGVEIEIQYQEALDMIEDGELIIE